MAARPTLAAERVNVEARRMILARPVDTLSGWAALLCVGRRWRQGAGCGAQWASATAGETGRGGPFPRATQGACVMELSGIGPATPLSAGDGAVRPRGSRHTVR